MTRAEQAVLATSHARDLCLSLQRAFLGPKVLEVVRLGQSARLTSVELRVALGLAWVERDLSLMRAALARVPSDRIASDPALAAFADLAR